MHRSSLVSHSFVILQSADTMRTDQDLNGGLGVQTQWPTVQWAIEQCREYMLQLAKTNATVLTIYPDMDNLFVGNNASLSGITDRQRQTAISHWIGAGANVILGSDMTALDSFGLKLLTNQRAVDVAQHFSAKYPMRPTQGNENLLRGRQGQVWLAGLDDLSGEAVILVANSGNSGNNNLFDPLPRQSRWTYNFTLNEMGLDGNGTYLLENICDPSADFIVQGNLPVSGTLEDSQVTF